MDNPDVLNKVIGRLPFSLRRAWLQRADEIMYERKQDVNIDHIADFIKKKAREINNPIFGGIITEAKPNSKQKSSKNYVKHTSTFAVNAMASIKEAKQTSHSPNQTKSAEVPNKSVKKTSCCALCDSTSHFTNQCEQFREMKYAERLKFVQDKKLCFACLLPGHFSSNCTRKPPYCIRPGCNGLHTTLMHPPKNNESSQPNKSQDECISAAICATVTGTPGQTYLPVLPVQIRSKNSSAKVLTYAFLDRGSTVSFCTQSLIKSLNVQGQKVELQNTTINKTTVETTDLICDLEISDVDGNVIFPLHQLYSTKTIPVTENEIISQDEINQIKGFEEVFTPKLAKGTKVDLLIGSNYSNLLIPHLSKLSPDSSLYASKTALGWVVSGPNHTGIVGNMEKSFFIKSNIQEMCNLCFDNVESTKDEKLEMSISDTKFLKYLESSIHQREDSHYEIPLPVKNADVKLPNNYFQAKQRLLQLKTKFARNPKFFDDYQMFIQNMVKEGYAIKSENSEVGNTFFIPHHGLYHPRKPEKIRVVFDCAAKSNGISMNDYLMKGPDLTNPLTEVLTRFRMNNVAIMGDITAMFHQVKVPAKDQPMFSFLWWKDDDPENEIEIFQMTVYIFGTNCSPACANFALRQTALDQQTKYSPEVVETVKNNFYVDDCLASTETEESAIKLINDLTEMLQNGGFHIGKWLSNNSKVLDAIPNEDKAKDIAEINFEEADSIAQQRALGVRWSINSDVFKFAVSYPTKEKLSTRRGILSLVASIYDPLGFISPVIQPIKVVLQDLTKSKLDWDAKIDPEQISSLSDWLDELHFLEKFSINRCVKPEGFGKVDSIQYHHFSDASLKSYGNASYIRLENENGAIHCSLLFGKTRLCPIKELTVPRLELVAATISISLDKQIKSAFKHTNATSYYWTDSSTVLRYLGNEENSYKTFVANRVNKITNYSNKSQWYFVPTDQNPADISSRGMKISQFINCDLWKHGPSFLWCKKSQWPKQPLFKQTTENLELKNTVKCFSTTNESCQNLFSSLPTDMTWEKLKCSVAWMIRYMKILKNKINKSSCDENLFSNCSLTCDELNDAEIKVIKLAQSEYFTQELLNLQRNKPVKVSSKIIKLDPILIDGLICVGGRLQKSTLSSNAKHQIIVPKESSISMLLLKHYHVKCGHSGREHSLSLLRERFWIPSANAMVRKVIHRCFDCRKHHGSPGVQKMSELPETRLIPNKPPFSFVGTDYFGPFMVRQKRSQIKRYGVVFTCYTTRAIHIEIAHSMDTDSFIMALRRFIARRGMVEEISSDNGTNYIGSERELRESIQTWNNHQINACLRQHNVKWNFNTPSASHHGGVWERVIRTIRKLLTAICHEQILDDERLLTLMCEVEGIINSRPLTTVSEDPNDFEAITPNHLLLMKQTPNLPPGCFDRKDLYARKRWKQIQYLADIFWNRWCLEYLPLMQQREKWHSTTRNFKVDDIVLIVDRNQPRNSWLIGRIIETFNDRNNLVRNVKIQTKSSILQRPISKICLLSAIEEANFTERD